MGEIEINHHIQMAFAKLATMTNLIQNSTIHLNTRVKVLNSFVRSRRKMIGGFKSIGDNGEYFRHKVNNLKIHATSCTSDVSNFI